MMNTEFDPYDALVKLSEQNVKLNDAMIEVVKYYNDLNRRMCIMENHANELELMIAELKAKDIRNDNQ